MLARARSGVYSKGSLREVTPAERAFAFEGLALKDVIKQRVQFVRQDIRVTAPPGRFDVILCRNQAFTYLDDTGQDTVARRLQSRLSDGGLIITGSHDGGAEMHQGVRDDAGRDALVAKRRGRAAGDAEVEREAGRGPEGCNDG